MAKLVAKMAGAVCGGLLIAVSSAAEPARDPVGGPECAQVSVEARNYGYGYNHVLTLSNRCARAVSCEVWTNVDPTPHLKLEAKPGQRASVVSRVGSPSRDVQAGKRCMFQ